MGDNRHSHQSGARTISRLFNDPAGDAIAGVSRWVGHEVVRLGVDHNRGAAVVEQGIGAIAEGDPVNGERGFALASAINDKVRQIAKVRVRGLRIVDAVMGTGGIEVTAGGGECRSFAFACVVDMDAVLAGGQVRDLDFDFDAF